MWHYAVLYRLGYGSHALINTMVSHNCVLQIVVWRTLPYLVLLALNLRRPIQTALCLQTRHAGCPFNIRCWKKIKSATYVIMSNMSTLTLPAWESCLWASSQAVMLGYTNLADETIWKLWPLKCTRMQDLASFVAKCYGGRPPNKIPCTYGTQTHDSHSIT